MTLSKNDMFLNLAELEQPDNGVDGMFCGVGSIGAISVRLNEPIPDNSVSSSLLSGLLSGLNAARLSAALSPLRRSTFLRASLLPGVFPLVLRSDNASWSSRFRSDTIWNAVKRISVLSSGSADKTMCGEQLVACRKCLLSGCPSCRSSAGTHTHGSHRQAVRAALCAYPIGRRGDGFAQEAEHNRALLDQC